MNKKNPPLKGHPEIWFAVNTLPKEPGARYTEVEICDGTITRSIHVRDEDLPITRKLTHEESKDLDALFVGVFPGGWSFADRFQEEHGDYKTVAFMPYETMKLDVREKGSCLLPRIESLEKALRTAKGTLYQIDAAGTKVLLGGKGAE